MLWHPEEACPSRGDCIKGDAAILGMSNVRTKRQFGSSDSARVVVEAPRTQARRRPGSVLSDIFYSALAASECGRVTLMSVDGTRVRRRRWQRGALQPGRGTVHALTTSPQWIQCGVSRLPVRQPAMIESIQLTAKV